LRCYWLGYPNYRKRGAGESHNWTWPLCLGANRMSDPILPLLPWESGTNENSLPANTNWLRIEAITRGTLSDSTTAQPGSPSDGDVYIIASTHTGAQWATFTPGDIAIYRAGNWSAWAPVTGLVQNVA